MSFEKQGFPDERDLELQQQSGYALDLGEKLVEWVGDHSPQRRDGDHKISPHDEFQLFRLRRLASNLWRSSKVPVAAAIYGASQVGKSLFIGQVLEPADERFSPLGKDEKLGPPAYIQSLSFKHDLNPNMGSVEATALVTRFTTKDRFDPDALSSFPVKVTALSRAEWIRVLARGFRSECQMPSEVMWGENHLQKLFEDAYKSHAGDDTPTKVRREWRMDLLDAYTYMRRIDPRLYLEEESLFNGMLSSYPLTEDGYVEIAGALFWDAENFPDITNLFRQVNRFLDKLKTETKHNGMLIHWGAVRFLLDSQLSPAHRSEHSQWKNQIAWKDFTDRIENDWYVIDYSEGAGGPDTEQATLQAAMLEMVIPILPERLNEKWRDVVRTIDLLDLPGARPERGGTEGLATNAKDRETQMTIVKRGKVFYLFERYIEERQIQTLLLLVRGGNLDVRGALKESVDRWGRNRYGNDVWPRKVRDPNPALFLGMTGIDDEFRTRAPDKQLYENRLRQVVNDSLMEIMTDFGGKGQAFNNVYPIRYPGTWDTNKAEREREGGERWTDAGREFLASEMVQTHVKDPEIRWEAAMRDGDGGLSLISTGFQRCTSAKQKQESLAAQIEDVDREIRSLGELWWANPEKNADREKRIDIANKVLEWLEDEEWVFHRVQAVKNALCFEEGAVMPLIESPRSKAARGGRIKPEQRRDRFVNQLRTLLEEWSKETAMDNWKKHTAESDAGGWLDADTFHSFTRYLGEYLSQDSIFDVLSDRLLSVISIPFRDASAQRRAQREYIQMILNDFVMNPGPDTSKLEEPKPLNGADFGLMRSLILRWRSRLPAALASAAGEHTAIPSGNDELRDILDNS